MPNNLMMEDEQLRALKRAYIQQLSQMPEYQGAPSAGEVVGDIGSTYKKYGGGFKGTGAAILEGLSGGLRYLGTSAQGKKILSGITKSPEASRFIYREGQALEPIEAAERAAFEQAKTGRVAEMGKYITSEEKRLRDTRKEEKETGDILTSGDKYKRETDLRKEFNKEVGDFPKVAQSYQRIVAVGTDPSPAGDLALIFNYMKMLDPGSVVRESEFATAAATGAFGERMKAAGLKITRGERLSPVMRNDFVKRANDLYIARETQYKQKAGEYTRIAQSAGLDPVNIIIQRGFVGEQPEFDTGVPKPGDIIDGYKFIGGDPNDENNWELQ